MKDESCVEFLRWCLPRLQKRWDGFRKVRGQVCKSIDRRIDALGLAGLEAYRSRLESDSGEWEMLDALCRITISRFNRDRRVFERLARDVFPALAAAGEPVRCWSAGCASGEEPYTLAVCWLRAGASSNPGRRASLEITATDVDEHMLERARRGCYQRGTLKELSDEVIGDVFERTGPKDEPYCVREEYRTPITWRRHDVRDAPPAGPFDLILCRNLAFMYYTIPLQRRVLCGFLTALRSGGALVIGKQEELPQHPDFSPWYSSEKIYRRREGPAATVSAF